MGFQGASDQLAVALLPSQVHPSSGRNDMIADVGDTRLFYQTAGNGSPILLMHGVSAWITPASCRGSRLLPTIAPGSFSTTTAGTAGRRDPPTGTPSLT